MWALQIIVSSWYFPVWIIVRVPYANSCKALSTMTGTQQTLASISSHGFSCPGEKFWMAWLYEMKLYLSGLIHSLSSFAISLPERFTPLCGPRWDDGISPQRGAFVSWSQPTLFGVCFCITCCGPVSGIKFTSLGLPTWEPSYSSKLLRSAAGAQCLLPMLFADEQPRSRNGNEVSSFFKHGWNNAWGL
jgi:hypothetical protein